MRKPKQERLKDIKAKKAFNKQFSKLNELERLKYLGLDPRDAFKMARSAEPKKVEKKIIDATKFYQSIPDNFFEPTKRSMTWLSNEVLKVVGDQNLANDIAIAVATRDLKFFDTIEDVTGELANIVNDYIIYKIAYESVYDSDIPQNSGVETTMESDKQTKIMANFAYMCNSLSEPNHYSHNGAIIENIFNKLIYKERDENSEVVVDLNQIMPAIIQNNGETVAQITKMDILKFIQIYDKLYLR